MSKINRLDALIYQDVLETLKNFVTESKEIPNNEKVISMEIVNNGDSKSEPYVEVVTINDKMGQNTYFVPFAPVSHL